MLKSLQIHADLTERRIFPSIFNKNVSEMEFAWTELDTIFAGMTT